MTVGSEQQIITSWRRNARPWVVALQRGAIASRVAVTNQAIVSAIAALTPQRVLDVGCGEGWLLRELAALDIAAEGVDAVAELVEAARQMGSMNCHCLSYAQLAEHRWPEPFDLAVCNFSLLGEAVAGPLSDLATLIRPTGRILVQTLHPCAYLHSGKYQGGWLAGSWQGLPEDVRKRFAEAPPWYFRRLSDWLSVFAEAGLIVSRIEEPAAEPGGEPLSIIFELRVSQ